MASSPEIGLRPIDDSDSAKQLYLIATPYLADRDIKRSRSQSRLDSRSPFDSQYLLSFWKPHLFAPDGNISVRI